MCGVVSAVGGVDCRQQEACDLVRLQLKRAPYLSFTAYQSAALTPVWPGHE